MTTLCRDDEIEQLEKVKANLKKLNFCSSILEFGKPIRFSNGKGVIIPASGRCNGRHYTSQMTKR